MKRELKYQDTEYFHYHNENPHNRKSGDCVIRAISTALEQSWEQTLREMCEIGIKYGYVPIDDKIIEKYLTQKGWAKQKEPRTPLNKKFITKDWINKNTELLKNNNVVAMVGSHHLSCIIDGKINDIWDCSYKTMHTYYIKN